MNSQIRALRVLIIEDTEERQEALTSLYRAHAWILVNTAPRAIMLLKGYDFDIVSLDYNLRGDQSGLEVAEALLTSRNCGARVIIHSLNPNGVERISSVLQDAIIYPVSKMIRSNDAFKRLRKKLDEQGMECDWT